MITLRRLSFLAAFFIMTLVAASTPAQKLQKLHVPVEGKEFKYVSASDQQQVESQVQAMIARMPEKVQSDVKAGKSMAFSMRMDGAGGVPTFSNSRSFANVVATPDGIQRAVSVSLEITREIPQNATIIRFRSNPGTIWQTLRAIDLFYGAGPYWTFDLQRLVGFNSDEFAGFATYGAILFTPNEIAIVQRNIVANPYESSNYGITADPVIRNLAYRNGQVTADFSGGEGAVSISLHQMMSWGVLIPQDGLAWTSGGQLTLNLNADPSAQYLPPGEYLVTATGSNGLSGSGTVWIDTRSSFGPTPVPISKPSQPSPAPSAAAPPASSATTIVTRVMPLLIIRDREDTEDGLPSTQETKEKKPGKKPGRAQMEQK